MESTAQDFPQELPQELRESQQGQVLDGASTAQVWQRNLAALRDYVELSTHWRPGGIDRHEALKVALPALESAASPSDALRRANDAALVARRQADLARAVANAAIAHLHAVLNKPRTHHEQQAADTAAREWLQSIGSEPN